MRNRANANKRLKNGVPPAQMQQLKTKLVNIESRLIESHEAERNRREQSAVDKIKDNTKYFFKYAREHSHVKKPIGPLTDASNMQGHMFTVFRRRAFI